MLRSGVVLPFVIHVVYVFLFFPQKPGDRTAESGDVGAALALC